MGWQEDEIKRRSREREELARSLKNAETAKEPIRKFWGKLLAANESLDPAIRLMHNKLNNTLYGRDTRLQLQGTRIEGVRGTGDNASSIAILYDVDKKTLFARTQYGVECEIENASPEMIIRDMCTGKGIGTSLKIKR